MHTNLVIRRATKEDLPYIRFIEKYSFYPYLYRTTKYFNKLINYGYIFSAEVDEEVVAYMSLVVHKRYIEVRDLAVFLTYRKKGIATSFFNIIFFLARLLKKKYIRLYVDIENTIALSFYQKIGFKEKKSCSKYYGRTDGIFMIADLCNCELDKHNL